MLWLNVSRETTSLLGGHFRSSQRPPRWREGVWRWRPCWPGARVTTMSRVHTRHVVGTAGKKHASAPGVLLHDLVCPGQHLPSLPEGPQVRPTTCRPERTERQACIPSCLPMWSLTGKSKFNVRTKFFHPLLPSVLHLSKHQVPTQTPAVSAEPTSSPSPPPTHPHQVSSPFTSRQLACSSLIHVSYPDQQP